METAPLKSFATWARTALIREVAARIAVVLAPASPERVEHSNAIAALEKAVRAAGGGGGGRAAVADKVAYTWFNRIIALRFMDANGYTGIGVVSPERGREVGQPEVLAEAKRGNIDSMVITKQPTVETVTALLNGTRRSDDPQGEAYSLLLAEYCRYWNRSMPFMFEREGDYTELLIPANLLADDSVLSRAVAVLTEDVCEDVEVIGWLYQFYISDRKAEVFAAFKKGKKAGAAEIAAATQLFTPHWIVRYLVENSLGRLWLLNRPTSRLVERMEYYIAPVDEETDFLRVTSPEDLKIIDPACGSGHMLTCAFDLLYAIYEEEGYAPSDIPGLILANNLYGIEIDPRAGALAAFALTMKARTCQRTFFTKKVKPNVCVLEPISFTRGELDVLLTPDGDRSQEEAFWNMFQHADSVGCLIRPSDQLIEPLKRHLDVNTPVNGDLFAAAIHARARAVIVQADLLSTKYSIVVANPPYMGSANLASPVRDALSPCYKVTRSDLYAMLAERALSFVVEGGFVALVTMQAWMFTTSYEPLRKRILEETRIAALAQFGRNAFESISGEVVSTAAYVLRNSVPTEASTGAYLRLVDGGPEEKAKSLRGKTSLMAVRQSLLRCIPGYSMVYWEAEYLATAFKTTRPVADYATIREGIHTGDNATYLRYWWEVPIGRLALGITSTDHLARSGGKWVPYNKGGTYARWYGHNYWVIAYDEKSRSAMAELPGHVRPSQSLYFREGATWSDVGSAGLALKYFPKGYLFADAGPVVVTNLQIELLVAGMNSKPFGHLAELLMPNLHYKSGTVQRVPFPRHDKEAKSIELGRRAIELVRAEWDANELSFDFSLQATVAARAHGPSLAGAVRSVEYASERAAQEIQIVEFENDRIYAEAYGVDVDLIELNRPDAIVPHSRPEQIKSLVSYAVACMFGRYSLDEPGLILANHGETLQDYLVKVPMPSFMPDADNVIPIVDGDWFEDDIVARFRQFLRVAFGEHSFEENLRFVTEALGVRDLRDYFVRSFYKDHVQRYKKRPIYWLFSSPKGSFNALIYMHRYTPSTVSTVLNEYLREFRAKLEASRQHHERRASGAETLRQRAAAHKEVDRLRTVLLELDEYEHGVLYPLATQQVQIDLDDGIKANYPKFGGALKMITGLEASDE
jgi:hypothetical protein